jgi:hypothetical protein
MDFLGIANLGITLRGAREATTLRLATDRVLAATAGDMFGMDFSSMRDIAGARGRGLVREIRLEHTSGKVLKYSRSATDVKLPARLDACRGWTLAVTAVMGEWLDGPDEWAPERAMTVRIPLTALIDAG